MKNNLFKYIMIVGIVLILTSLIIIITKTPPPKPKAGAIDITENANFNASEFGGDFILLDQNGNNFDSKSLKGKYQLIYFGFTSCPDICPASLMEVINAMNMVDQSDKLKGSLVPIFITIDPKRDTSEALKSYFDAVDPRIIALTGSDQEINEVAKKFRVYYSVVKGAGKEQEDPNYMVNHSSFFYLVGPDGKFIKPYFPGTKGFDIAKDYLKIVKNYNDR